jgi:carbonic anhydrase
MGSSFPQLKSLLERNKAWAEKTNKERPELLPTLAKGQVRFYVSLRPDSCPLGGFLTFWRCWGMGESRRADGQAPKILWMGCGDSRVPEGVIAGADIGEIFVQVS